MYPRLKFSLSFREKCHLIKVLHGEQGKCFALSPGQTIPTCQRNMSQHCWAKHVACVWPPCCDMLGVVGSSLKLVKFEPTTPNMSQHGGQTHATCCAQQCWALTLSGLFMGLSSTLIYTSELILCSTICVPSATRHNIQMLRHVVLACCDRLAGALGRNFFLIGKRIYCSCTWLPCKIPKDQFRYTIDFSTRLQGITNGVHSPEPRSEN